MHPFNLMFIVCLSSGMLLFSLFYKEDQEADAGGQRPTLPRNAWRLISAGFRSVLVKKSRAAKYLITGLGLVFTGYIVYVLSLFKMLPVDGEFWLLTAGVAGLVFFALSLTERLEAVEKAVTGLPQQPPEPSRAESQWQEKATLAEKANEALQKDVAAGTREMERQAREIERLAGEMARQAGELARVKQLLREYTRRLEVTGPESVQQTKSAGGPAPGRHPAPASTDHAPVPNPKPEPLAAGQPAQQNTSFEAFQKQFPNDEA